MPSIFKQVADRLKVEKQKLELEVLGLDTDIDKMATRGNEAVMRHKRVINTIHEGLGEMEAGIRELEGNGEEDDDKVASFPDKTGTHG